MSRKIKKYQKVEIEWYDSLHSSGWLKESDVQLTDKDRMTHKTTGYFIAGNERSIIVVQSYQCCVDGEPMVDSVMEIPIKAIIKIKLY